jgi:hypothetical protein
MCHSSEGDVLAGCPEELCLRPLATEISGQVVHLDECLHHSRAIHMRVTGGSLLLYLLQQDHSSEREYTIDTTLR